MFYNEVLKILARTIRKENKIKGVLFGKEGVKVSLFTNDRILYIRDSKILSRKFQEMINTFSKVFGYKINLQNSLEFSI